MGGKLSYWIDCVKYVGELLLTRGSDGKALLWEGGGGGEGGEVAIGEDGGESLNGSDARVVRDFGAGNVRVGSHRVIPHTHGMWHLRFALDAKRTRLAIGNVKGEVFVWPLLSSAAGVVGAAMAHGNVGGGERPASAAASSENGGEESGGEATTTYVRPIATLKVSEIATVSKGDGDYNGAGNTKAPPAKRKAASIDDEVVSVRCTAVSHDGTAIVCGCADGSICCWELPAV